MASYMYKTDKFLGIDQSTEESFLPAGASPDAENMDTSDGNLTVAGGFSRISRCPLPDTDTIYRCIKYHQSDGDVYAACAGDNIYIGFLNTWLCLHTYHNSLTEHIFDFLEVKIGTTDCLLIANGESQILKYDGHEVDTFGSEEMCSDRPVRYMAMYKNRLFCAGDSEHPNRLYWSKLPGDGRSIEDWSSGEASVNVNGGHTEIGLFDNDPITGICALASQLLIFRKNSLYRLYGDKPSDFTVEKVESVTEYAPHTAIVHYGDAAFFMTKSGLYVYDGVSAHLMRDCDKIRKVLKECDLSHTHGVRVKDKLVYTAQRGSETILIEYDLKRGTYMLRTGFDVSDIFADENSLYVVSDRYVCKFDDSTTYAGEPIHAYWRTPLTDLSQKSVIKQLCELYMRGDPAYDGVINLTTQTGGIRRFYRVRITDDEVTEVPLCDEGRAFSLCYENLAGGRFSLRGGTELRINMRGRCV